LNGAGCAAAVPAASVDANSNAANAVAFMVVSLSSWISLVAWRSDANAISRRNDAKARTGGFFSSLHGAP
jgi:hypothetical protein